MTRHYATLFDVNYAAKGVAMYESLKRHSSEEFMLHILAMDEHARAVLNELNLPNVQVMPLPAFERAMNLSEVKASRTHQEWCWTAASQCLSMLMRWIGDDVTYIDSDVFFYRDPKEIFDELADRSIAITPHRLIPSKKYLEVNGIFNVGIIVIRNTEAGRRCISKWAAQTREWCFNRAEGNKFADQGYLTEWPSLYGSDCCIIENIGVNAGPWSIGNWKITEGPRLDGVPLNSYHFHEFLQREDGTFRLTNYELRDEDRQFIYAPYIKAITRANRQIATAESSLASQQSELQLQSERV